MKKSIFILVVMVFCLQITGLTQETRVGITGGLSLSNMKGTVNGVDQKGDSRTGFVLGMILDRPITDHITFQPGLHYIQKGKKENQDNGNLKQDFITALRYAELQLNILFNTKSDQETLFIGAGPAVGINLPSKFVTDIGGTKTETEITFGNEAENFRGFDFGANVLAGINFKKGFLVSFNYTLGLRNIFPGGGTNDIKNSCFGVRIGWLIANK